MAGVGYVATTLTLKIGSTQYETAVLSVKENVTYPTVTAVMASGDVMVDAGVKQYELVVEFNVDVATASLYRILDAATAGSTATFECVYDPVGNPAIKRTGTVMLSPGAVQWKSGEFTTASATLPMVGQPVWA